MIDFLNQHWWFALIVFAFLFVGDHYMTVIGAKLHKSHAAQHYVPQMGYELNPKLEKEVAEFKWFTRKHFLALLAGMVVLIVSRLFETALYEFFLGSYLLLWLYIDLGHVRNILYFRDIRRPNIISGRIESSYWLSQRAVFFEYLSQAILFSVVAISIARPFFWGGVVAFLFQSFRHLSLANRKFTESSDIPLQGARE
jgi:hypothetical protein